MLERNWRKIKTQLEELEFKVSANVLAGIPFKKIVKIADKEGVSLIVLSSHGRS